MSALKPRIFLNGLLLIASLVAVGYALEVMYMNDMLDKTWIDHEVRGKGVGGELLFLGMGALATALGAPRQAISFLAGYAFDVALGTVLGVAATVGGCLLSFYYARWFGRALVTTRFRERTRRSRLYHFRQLAQSALAAYGLADANLSFIQYGENITYRVDHPSARPGVPGESPYHPNRYLLRILAMDDEQATLSELTWLAALHQEAGLPVPMPVAAPDGQLLLRIATPAIPQGRVVSLMRWLDGRKIQKGTQPHHLKALGQVVARLHNFSATWQPPAGPEADPEAIATATDENVSSRPVALSGSSPTSRATLPTRIPMA